MNLRAIVACACLALPAWAQDAEATRPPVDVGPATDADNLFYRAFFLERGERRWEKAIDVYRAFLQRAPEHRYRDRAASSVIRLLQRAGRSDEARKFQEQIAGPDAKSETEAAAKGADAAISVAADTADTAAAADAATDRAKDRTTDAAANAEKAASVAIEGGDAAARTAALRERIAAAKAAGDDALANRLERQLRRSAVDRETGGRDAAETPRRAGAGDRRGAGNQRGAGQRGAGNRRGLGNRRGGLFDTPLTEMDERQLAGFKQRLPRFSATIVDRIRQSGDDERADKLQQGIDKVAAALEQGELEKAQELLTELRSLMRRRR